MVNVRVGVCVGVLTVFAILRSKAETDTLTVHWDGMGWFESKRKRNKKEIFFFK